MGRAFNLAAALVLLTAPGFAGAGDTAPLLSEAHSALERGDGIAAEIALKKAQDAGASRPQIAAPMGEALIIQNNLVGARKWLGEGRFAANDAGYGWRMLGMLERFSGNLAAAEEAYQRAAAMAPDDPLVWSDIGRLRFSQGDQVGAVGAANKALLADPDNPRALELRAQMLREQAGWEAALPLYERALLRAPKDIDLLAGYAGTLGEAGRMRDMLTVTRSMIALNAKDPRAWFYQAVLAARAGNVDLARSLLDHTRSRFDGMPAGLLLRGALELEAGNANVAVSLLDGLIQRQPANSTAQLLLARALYEAGDTRGLLGRFAGLAGRPDASSYLLALMARTLEEQGDRAGAAQYLDRLAKAAPAPVMPVAEHGSDDVAGAVRRLIAGGNFAAANLAAVNYAKQRPGMFEALSLAGDTSLAQSQSLPALDYYRRAMAVRFPDRMLLRSVEALERSGRGSQVPAVVVGYLGAWPSSRLAARLAAGHAAYAGDWAHSRLLLETIVLRTGTRDARVMADLSLAQTESGDPEMALVSAERAALLLPNSGFAAQAWGLALVGLNAEPDAARALLTKARRIDGDNPRIAAALKGLGK